MLKIFFSLIVLSFAFWGIKTYWLSSVGEAEVAEEKRVAIPSDSKKNLPYIRTQIIRPEDAEAVDEYSGATEPFKATNVESEVSGRIKKRYIEEGSAVQEGDLLFELHDDDRSRSLLTAQSEMSLRQMQYDAAKKLEAKKFTSPISLAVAKNNLEVAKLKLKTAELNQSRLKIRAPFSGVVSKVYAETNHTISPSLMDPKLCHIVALDPLRIVFHVPEASFLQFKHGQDITVHIPPHDTKIGKIVFIAPVVDEETRTFKIKADMRNPGYLIPAGFAVDVAVKRSLTNIHKIDASWIVLSKDGKPGVMTVYNNVTKFIPIKVLHSGKTHFLVQGLSGSVRVIVLGQEGFRSGIKVRYKDNE